GHATVIVTGPDGRAFDPLVVEVIASPPSEPNGTDGSLPLSALERGAHQVVTFSGAAVPHSAQVLLSYDPDGARPVVINPRPALKNVVWAENAGVLRVLVTPTSGQTPTDFTDFAF